MRISTLAYPESPRSKSSSLDKCNSYLSYKLKSSEWKLRNVCIYRHHFRCIQSWILFINVLLCGLIIRKNCWNVVNSPMSNQRSDTWHKYPAFQFFRFRLRDSRATLKLGLLTQKWGRWKYFFSVTLSNFQKKWGGGGYAPLYLFTFANPVIVLLIKPY